MTSDTNFTGEVVAVLGGFHGLGALCAADLADRGAAVLTAHGTGRRNHAHGANGEGKVVLVEPERLVERAKEIHGRLDALLLFPDLLEASGANGAHGPAADHIGAEVADVLALQNALTRQAMHEFHESGGGRIVLTTSAVGLFGHADEVVRAVIEAATVGMLRCLALQANAPRIRVNGISPIVNVAPYDRTIRDRPWIDPDAYDPRHVLPVIAHLAHRDCMMNGAVLSAGGGRFARIVQMTSAGVFDPRATCASLAAEISRIVDLRYPVEPRSAADELLLIEV
jgi:NAD(P)-dependent dehydrogenase (short-subunit alcohol dehydrogenase family)